MSDIAYPYREDRSCSGFFEFTNTGVQYADTGIVGLKQYMPFDQGGWAKVDGGGASSIYELDVDTGNFRVSDSLTCVATGAHVLYRRLRVPRDYGSWSSITFFVTKNTGGITSLTASLLKNATADAGINGRSVRVDSRPNTASQILTVPGQTSGAISRRSAKADSIGR